MMKYKIKIKWKYNIISCKDITVRFLKMFVIKSISCKSETVKNVSWSSQDVYKKKMFSRMLQDVL
jgi:hypothetical protein